MTKILDMAALFSSRLGAILANLFAIPLYVGLLSPEAFGQVALVLSAQNFFLFFDFGVGAAIGREVAAARGTGDAARLLSASRYRRRVERLLWLIATTLSLIAFLASHAGTVKGATLVAATAPLIAILVAQNIVQLSLNALGRFGIAALINLGSIVLRTALALAFLDGLRSDAMSFAAGHLVGGLIVLLIARAALARIESRFADDHADRPTRQAEMGMSRASILLMLYTFGGAAALNLDKPLVSAFFSLADAGRYFLATTFALVPVGILAGPLNQYFQPQLASAWAAGDRSALDRLSSDFQMMTVIAVALPATLLFVDADFWLHYWLRGEADVAQIADLARPMLAGAAIGATGYLPTALLIAAGDNGFLAKLSVSMAAAVLLAAAGAASMGSLTELVWVYTAFHITGCCLLWGRMVHFCTLTTLSALMLRSYIGPAVLLVVTGWILAKFEPAIRGFPHQFASALIGAGLVAGVALWVWSGAPRSVRSKP